MRRASPTSNPSTHSARSVARGAQGLYLNRQRVGIVLVLLYSIILPMRGRVWRTMRMHIGSGSRRFRTIWERDGWKCLTRLSWDRLLLLRSSSDPSISFDFVKWGYFGLIYIYHLLFMSIVIFFGHLYRCKSPSQLLRSHCYPPRILRCGVFLKSRNQNAWSDLRGP